MQFFCWSSRGLLLEPEKLSVQKDDSQCTHRHSMKIAPITLLLSAPQPIWTIYHYSSVAAVNSPNLRTSQIGSHTNVHKVTCQPWVCQVWWHTLHKYMHETWCVLFAEDTVTCDSSTGVNNKMNDGWIPFCWCRFKALVLFMLAHCHTVMAFLNTT